MKTKTRLLALGLAALLATPATAQEFTLKFSTMGAPTSPIPQCIAFPLLEEIKEASGGRIDYETYMGGTAFAKPTKQYEQVARGVMDVSEGPLTYVPGRFALSEIATIPLLMSDNVAGSIAMTRLADEWLAEEFEDIHLMGIILTTPYQFHLVEPLEDITNLEGRRLRVSGPGLTAMVETFGGTPAAMPLPESYENMQRGVIDGAIAPWTAVAAFKLQEVSKTHVQADLSVGLTFIGMSKKFFDSLPPDLQDLMQTEFMGERIAEHGASCFRKVDGVATKLAEESGNEIVTLSAEDRDRAIALLEPVVDELIADVEAKGKPGRAFYEALKAEIATVEAELAAR
jgi:TRAP-type C4-dicarboxylate transport system substrate-binding protein